MEDAARIKTRNLISCLTSSLRRDDKGPLFKRARLDDKVEMHVIEIKRPNSVRCWTPVVRGSRSKHPVAVDLNRSGRQFLIEHAQGIAVQRALTLAKHLAHFDRKPAPNDYADYRLKIGDKTLRYPLGRIALDSEIENWDKELGIYRVDACTPEDEDVGKDPILAEKSEDRLTLDTPVSAVVKAEQVGIRKYIADTGSGLNLVSMQQIKSQGLSGNLFKLARRVKLMTAGGITTSDKGISIKFPYLSEDKLVAHV